MKENTGDFEGQDDFWELTYASCPTTDNELDAKDVINDYGGHIVTLIEEHEKLVLSKEQAEIVEGAHDEESPATYISYSANLAASDDEELLMNAYVSGYTVEKEKKYNVKVPHTRFYYWKWKADEPGIDALTSDNKKDEIYRFTKADIEHYGLQDCKKEEVTDDEQ